MIRALIRLPLNAARTAVELPRSMERSIREANALMEVSREQLEVMRRQADQALEQAERMNELLARVVRLTEPLERAQRGGEYVGERIKRAIFGAEEERELALEQAERAVEEAEEAAKNADDAVGDAAARGDMGGGSEDATARERATRGISEEPPDSSAER